MDLCYVYIDMRRGKRGLMVGWSAVDLYKKDVVEETNRRNTRAIYVG